MIFFYFQLSPVFTCIALPLKRSFLVSHLYPNIHIKLYEYFAPEHFNETILSLPGLSQLTPCDICGSSECSECEERSSLGERTSAVALTIIISYISSRII